MKDIQTIDPLIEESIRYLEDYIEQTTGVRASPTEISAALKKYFVLKEIREFIEMFRKEGRME